MNLLDLLNEEGGHSGTGISYYSTKCPRQARLDREAPQQPSSYHAKVGTVFHKLMELYYTNQLVNVALPIEDMPKDEDPIQEALRIFAVYRQYFPANEWDTLCVERQLPISGDSVCASRVCAAVGVSPFTARLDLVARFSDEQAGTFSRRNEKAVSAGRYLVDHKVRFARDAHAYLKWSLSPQFTAYFLAWEAAYPEETLNGIIVNNPIAHKRLTRDSFQRFVFDPPSESQRQALRSYLAWKKPFLDSDVCNLEACTEFKGCSHYTTGRCNRV